MLNVGVIGIGNAGGQVADLAAKLIDVDGIAINSSNEDLNNIENVSKLKIGDSKGSGKSRSEAKGFIKARIKDMVSDENIAVFFENKDVIFVISSIDGGTGSGSTPVTFKVLMTKFPSVRFILIPIYGANGDAAALENSVSFLKEIETMDITKLSFDNNKYANLSSDKMLETINNQIVESIKILRMDYNYSTPYESIDSKDMDRVISTPGEMFIANFSGFTEADLDDTTIEDRLIDICKGANNGQVNIERDKIVNTIAVISNLNSDLREKFNTHLDKLKEFVGTEVTSFLHYYVNEDDTAENRVIVILTGLSTPDNRIKMIIEKLAKIESNKRKAKKSSLLGTVDSGKIDALRETPKVEESSIDDILDEF